MWLDDQKWEASWWDGCTNTLDEEVKQLVVLKRFGFTEIQGYKTRFVFDMQGKRILDMGGGPVSLLLKCVNVKGFVLDPLKYPAWIYERYAMANIGYSKQKCEEIPEWIESWMAPLDEVWMYNLLQHTENPEAIVKNAKRLAPLVRVFDWLEQGVMPGHPQNLTEAKMNEWFGQKGTVERIDENGAKGLCYHGNFLTR